MLVVLLNDEHRLLISISCIQLTTVSKVVAQFTPYWSLPRYETFCHSSRTLSINKLSAASSANCAISDIRNSRTFNKNFHEHVCMLWQQVAAHRASDRKMWFVGRMNSLLQPCQLTSTEFYLPVWKSTGTMPVSPAGCTASLDCR